MTGGRRTARSRGPVQPAYGGDATVRVYFLIVISVSALTWNRRNRE